jgi:hypothetical protein
MTQSVAECLIIGKRGYDLGGASPAMAASSAQRLIARMTKSPAFAKAGLFWSALRSIAAIDPA